MKRQAVEISFPDGVPCEAQVIDGPGDRIEWRAGDFRLAVGMDATACAELAAFFAGAAERRNPDVVGPPTRAERAAPKRPRRGVTLMELLVVILIIGLVSAVALPVVLPALRSRQAREAARQLSAAIAGCRDRAIVTGEPAGIRLIPDPSIGVARLADGSVDPAAILAYSRWIPIGPAPQYAEGRATVRPGAIYAAAVTNPAGAAVAVPSLVLEAAPVDPATSAPNAPTSWAWNLRVGDKLQIGGSGPWYTIVGPDWTGPAAGNVDRFVNWGPPGTTSPLNPTGTAAVEWLLLVDGRDDNANGWPDEGWDGCDNDGDGLVDEASCAISPAGEWESEAWQGAAAGGLASAPYSVRRRPMPSANTQAVALPAAMVIDATTWRSTLERSRLPVDRWSGAAEILIQPDGSVTTQTVYGVPSSQGLGSAFVHIWLAERADLAAPAGTSFPALPAPKGESALVTIATRTGRVGVAENPDPATAFAAAQQGD